MRYIITALLFTVFTVTGFSQTAKIEGKITDSKTGQPLAGVSVSIAASNKGVITNQDGHFIISISSVTPQSVRISSIGYKTKLIENIQTSAGQVISLDVVLETAAKMEEAIVIKTTLVFLSGDLLMVSAETTCATVFVFF